MEAHFDDVQNQNDQSDSDDSVNGVDQEESALMLRADELEKQIDENKYCYYAHLELVDVYRKIADLDSMRHAYTRFHDIFPLSPQIWLQWILLETKISSGDRDRSHIIELFEKANNDYISVMIWQEYIQFSMGLGDEKLTRSTIERALILCGLNVGEGSLLWDTLREYELAHLSLAPEGSDKWKEQLDRVVDCFRRQLSVPLMNMESTYEEWQEFYNSLPKKDSIDPKPVEWCYKKALAILEKYKPHELNIATNEDPKDLYRIFKDYIAVMDDPSTILCTYERLITKSCLEPKIWLDYCNYAKKLGSTVLNVADRSIRNCPWSVELWINKMELLEQFERPYKEILETFEEGVTSLESTLELWLALLEYARRNFDSEEKLYKLFDQAIIHTHNHDTIIKYYCGVLGRNGNMPKFRETWKLLSNKPENKGLAEIWLEFINYEKLYGNNNNTLRNLYQKALNNCIDKPYLIAEEWLMFEREAGTLDDMIKCKEKCKPILTARDSFHQEQSTTDNNTSTSEPENDNNKKNKRKFNENESYKNKKPKVNKDHQQQQQQQQQQQAGPTFKKKTLKDPTRTVFISNLYPSINEKKLQKFFPNATAIEIVYDKLGKSRCYGYIEFLMEEEVSTALARDRELLDGKPLFISQCKPDKIERKKSFKYSTNIESNKLFIKNISHNTTKEDLEKIYKPLGAIDIRLVYKRSGESKGIAYVEFPDDQLAQKALEKTNKTDVNGSVIDVAISAPPQLKSTNTSNSSFNKSLTEPTTITHPRNRLSVPLIPRALQIRRKLPASAAANTAGTAESSTNNGHKEPENSN